MRAAFGLTGFWGQFENGRKIAESVGWGDDRNPNTTTVEPPAKPESETSRPIKPSASSKGRTDDD